MRNKSLFFIYLAVRVGFGLSGPIENTQLIDSTKSENAQNATGPPFVAILLRSDNEVRRYALRSPKADSEIVRCTSCGRLGRLHCRHAASGVPIKASCALRSHWLERRDYWPCSVLRAESSIVWMKSSNKLAIFSSSPNVSFSISSRRGSLSCSAKSRIAATHNRSAWFSSSAIFPICSRKCCPSPSERSASPSTSAHDSMIATN